MFENKNVGSQSGKVVVLMLLLYNNNMENSIY
jgi:hypothetical protein